MLSTICLSTQIARAEAGAKPAVIIDVRTPAEYAAGHIKGSINIPVDRIEEDIHTVPGIGKDSAILLYCRSGARSNRAVSILQKQGFTRPLNGGGLSDMAQRYPSCSYPAC